MSGYRWYRTSVLTVCLSGLAGGMATAPRTLHAQGALADCEHSTALRKAGDWVQIAIPAAGLATTVATRDFKGTFQWLETLGLTLVVTNIGKYAFDRQRPCGGSKSFPSGHTSAAFAGAGFLFERYGPVAGAPAYILASFVGVSRTETGKHYADDLLAGASVGQLAAWLFVTPRDDSASSTSIPDSVPRRWDYTFGFGPAFLRSNVIRSPETGGDSFDLYDFGRSGNPSPLAIGTLTFYWGRRHATALRFAPFEVRDVGSFSEPVKFAGVPFPADEEVVSRYRVRAFRAGYLFSPELPPLLDLGVGGDVDWSQTTLALTTPDGSLSGEIKEAILLPLVHARLGLTPSRMLDLTAELAVADWLDGKVADLTVTAGLHFGRRWDIRLGYRHLARELDREQLFHSVKYDVIYAEVGYGR